MRKILYLILFISSNLFSQNFTSYTFTNLVRKNPNFVKNFLEKMDWKQIKNENVNVLKYYYKNSSEQVQLNANIEIQFNKNEKNLLFVTNHFVCVKQFLFTKTKIWFIPWV